MPAASEGPLALGMARERGSSQGRGGGEAGGGVPAASEGPLALRKAREPASSDGRVWREAGIGVLAPSESRWRREGRASELRVKATVAPRPAG